MPELLIKYLNDQLVYEYKATFNYLYHSTIVKNAKIRKLMEEFSRNELEHARMLIRYIVSLNGKPVFAMPKVNQAQDEVELLIFSIAEEDAAIKKYTMIQQIIDNPEYKKIIGATINVEKEHYRKLNEILNEVKEAARTKG